MRRLSAVTFMNRLTYLQKFLLFGVLFMLPVGLTMYLLITDIDKEIDFARKERLGIEYNDGIRKLLEQLQQHRGMANIYLNGEASFKEALLKKQVQVNEAIEEIDQIDQRLGVQLKTIEKWKTIKEMWQSLKENAFSLQPKESFDLHSTIINENFELHRKSVV